MTSQLLICIQVFFSRPCFEKYCFLPTLTQNISENIGPFAVRDISFKSHDFCGFLVKKWWKCHMHFKYFDSSINQGVFTDVKYLPLHGVGRREGKSHPSFKYNCLHTGPCFIEYGPALVPTLQYIVILLFYIITQYLPSV